MVATLFHSKSETLSLTLHVISFYTTPKAKDLLNQDGPSEAWVPKPPGMLCKMDLTLSLIAMSWTLRPAFVFSITTDFKAFQEFGFSWSIWQIQLKCRKGGLWLQTYRQMDPSRRWISAITFPVLPKLVRKARLKNSTNTSWFLVLEILLAVCGHSIQSLASPFLLAFGCS